MLQKDLNLTSDRNSISSDHEPLIVDCQTSDKRTYSFKSLICSTLSCFCTRKHFALGVLFLLFCICMIWNGYLDKFRNYEFHKNFIVKPLFYGKVAHMVMPAKYAEKSSPFNIFSPDYSSAFSVNNTEEGYNDFTQSPSKCQKLKPSKVEREMPEVVKFYKTPENADVKSEWTLSAVGAFYDYRLNKVVLIITSDAAGLAKKGYNFTFVCIFLYDNNTIASYTDGYFFTSYIFYCPLPATVRLQPDGSKSRLIPEAISVIRNDSSTDTPIKWTLPVINLLERKLNRDAKLASDKIDPAKNLALCVGILYGFQSWLTVLQYIEFHRLQGVQKFFFFYYQMHFSVEDIFRWYAINEPGLIEPVHWEPPPYDSCGGEYRCQMTRNNYCTYLLMHKYKYVGDNDFDELFFPANSSQNLVELLNSIDASSRGSFTFRARYHQYPRYNTPAWENLTSAEISTVIRQFLPLILFRNVSTMAPHYYSPKTVTKPETVIRRWIHYTHSHVKGYGTYHPTLEQGFLRHFKYREWWGHFYSTQADGIISYNMTEPEVEIGKSRLQIITSNVERVASEIKHASENWWKLVKDC